jgi:hypothetical protein
MTVTARLQQCAIVEAQSEHERIVKVEPSAAMRDQTGAVRPHRARGTKCSNGRPNRRSQTPSRNPFM